MSEPQSARDILKKMIETGELTLDLIREVAQEAEDLKAPEASKVQESQEQPPKEYAQETPEPVKPSQPAMEVLEEPSQATKLGIESSSEATQAFYKKAVHDFPAIGVKKSPDFEDGDDSRYRQGKR